MKAWDFTIIFYSPSGNVFTPENVTSLLAVVQAIKNLPKFSKYCWAVSSVDSSCATEKSAIPLLTGGYASQSAIDTALTTLVGNTNDFVKARHFFETNFGSTYIKSAYTRVILKMGAPINIDGVQYKSKNDREMDQ
jgi:hypothetical protein